MDAPRGASVQQSGGGQLVIALNKLESSPVARIRRQPEETGRETESDTPA